MFGGGDFGQLAVSLDAQGGVADIGGGDEGGHQLFRASGQIFAFVVGEEIEPRFDFEPRSQLFTF